MGRRPKGGRVGKGGIEKGAKDLRGRRVGWGRARAGGNEDC